RSAPVGGGAWRPGVVRARLCWCTPSAARCWSGGGRSWPPRSASSTPLPAAAAAGRAGDAHEAVAHADRMAQRVVARTAAAIDVAIAGDDEPVPMLARAWADTAKRASSAAELLAVAAEVITAAQRRSAGLVLAVFEGGRTDPELAALATELTEQRAATVRW